MGKYELTLGVRKTAIRLFIYGPEGIGKSTLAAMLPNPVFIDVESGTNQLPVARMPRPTSWEMLCDEIRSVRDGDVPSCQTLVIDTADASEGLCTASVCASNGVEGIEKISYGKGYVFAKEKWCRMLDLLGEVVERNINVVLVGHSRLDKFERPDESGSYDRFSPKLIDTKKASICAATKEWSDMVLFVDYKIYVQEENGKAKAHGGKRVVHTTHHPCWDAKNRFGLPEEMPLDDTTAMKLCEIMTVAPEASANASVVDITPEPAPEPTQPESNDMADVDKLIASMDEDLKKINAGPTPEPEGSGPDPRDSYPPRLKALADLMRADGIGDEDIRRAVGAKGYFPQECPVEQYPDDFAQWLTSVWASFVTFVKEQRELIA